ncbi:M1 family metallopeptidase [Zhouia sp. PK063]|uniref:M1 family metallopeptidase n=1 Tax=Zhouia sp. PK063 TaxID=3373602 RepID=UPI0037B2B042
MRITFLISCMLLFLGRAVAQQTQIVDFKTGDISIHIKPEHKEVTGKVMYRFAMLQNADSIFIDAQKMNITSVVLNSVEIKFKNDNKKLWLISHFKAHENYTVAINYDAHPAKAMYFIGWDNEGQNQVWTQGQGKYTSNWVPSLDDMNDKVVYQLHITFNKNYQVIANGKLESKKEGVENITWNYKMKKPISAYLLAIAAGKYQQKNEMSNNGVPINMYYYLKDSLKVSSTYQYTKEIFDFFENKIGVNYAWQNYKIIPVKDFLYGGMENASATIFTDASMVNDTAAVDESFVNVNAHELAHQWFGDLVTEKSGTHHWLQEGFATFYALQAERKIFGDDHYYAEIYKTARDLKQASDNGEGEPLLNDKASSLTFYQKGAWTLIALQRLIGEHDFDKAVKQYLKKYAFKNVTTPNFLDEVEKVSGKKLNDFKQTWLKDSIFHYHKATQVFKNQLMNIASLIDEQFATKEKANSEASKTLWGNLPAAYKATILQYDFKNLNTDFYISSVLNDVAIKPRQELIQQIDTIPVDFQSSFESLLKDKSYATIEAALYKLWVNFPENGANYLNQTKNSIGFSNKNVRMLWLTLALVTPNYEQEKKKGYYEELSGYTQPKFAFQIRQNAFQYLYQLNAFNNQNLKDLVNACLHPAWHFASFARNILENLLKNPQFKIKFQSVLSDLPENEQHFLEGKLNQ